MKKISFALAMVFTTLTFAGGKKVDLQNYEYMNTTKVEREDIFKQLSSIQSTNGYWNCKES